MNRRKRMAKTPPKETDRVEITGWFNKVLWKLGFCRRKCVVETERARKLAVRLLRASQTECNKLNRYCEKIEAENTDIRKCAEILAANIEPPKRKEIRCALRSPSIFELMVHQGPPVWPFMDDKECLPEVRSEVQSYHRFEEKLLEICVVSRISPRELRYSPEFVFEHLRSMFENTLGQERANTLIKNLRDAKEIRDITGGNYV
jgi:hypothetical protein